MELTLKELRCSIESYNGKKVAFEGVITINSGNDGVSLLCAYLFEQATDINFFFGKAENTANDDLDIGMDAKAIVINRLISSLREMGKNVKISRC